MEDSPTPSAITKGYIRIWEGWIKLPILIKKALGIKPRWVFKDVLII